MYKVGAILYDYKANILVEVMSCDLNGYGVLIVGVEEGAEDLWMNSRADIMHHYSPGAAAAYFEEVVWPGRVVVNGACSCDFYSIILAIGCQCGGS